MALFNFERANSMDFHKTEEFYVNIGVAYAKAENYAKSLQYLLKAEELGGNTPIINLRIWIKRPATKFITEMENLINTESNASVHSDL